MKVPLVAIFIACSIISEAQDPDDVFSRMQAISRNGMDFFSIDGIEISYLPMKGTFTQKTITKNYRQLKVKAQDLIASDSLLDKRNYYVSKTIDRSGLPGYADYYFIDGDGRTLAVAFQSKYKPSQEFERQIATLCINKQIPKSIYQPVRMDSINFAGRYIYLGGPCQWMGVNNLQCPGNGQMSWSLFQSLEQAQADLDDHFEYLKRSSKGKVISDEQIDVLFEGQDVKARKFVFDFKGITSALMGMSGGKTLTVFMVAAPVRGRFVGAVMSHWNNDYVGKAGVPALTYDVMHLKGLD
jgi:hypothetical protein